MDTFSASAIVGYLPVMAFPLPFFGTIDITPFVAALVIFLTLTFIFWVLRALVLTRLRAWSRLTSVDIDDAAISAVRSIRPWAYSVVALYLSLQFFNLPYVLDLIARSLFLFTLVWQAIEVILAFVRYGTTKILAKDLDNDGMIDPGPATASNMVALLARIVLWALGIVFVLSNLGIEVTSLIAGLGIGGIAVAFALQGILSDLFASFSIYFDKPFRIGDYIVIGNNSGTVEKIGIKTTRIRTLQGEELVVSNAELTSIRVQNFKKMQERRIAFTIGIAYETPREKVEAVPGMIQEIIEKETEVRFDRVHFASFGDSALMFEIVYYVLSDDYEAYMDHQEAINLGIMAAFEKEKIAFAYPTQVVYMKK